MGDIGAGVGRGFELGPIDDQVCVAQQMSDSPVRDGGGAVVQRNQHVGRLALVAIGHETAVLPETVAALIAPYRMLSL